MVVIYGKSKRFTFCVTRKQKSSKKDVVAEGNLFFQGRTATHLDRLTWLSCTNFPRERSTNLIKLIEKILRARRRRSALGPINSLEVSPGNLISDELLSFVIFSLSPWKLSGPKYDEFISLKFVGTPRNVVSRKSITVASNIAREILHYCRGLDVNFYSES